MEAITKRELRERIVPSVKAYLRGELGLDLRWYDPIYTHASDKDGAAEIVFEGTEWTLGFEEVFDVAGYEVDPYNSYALTVRRELHGKTS